jgi:integrase
MWVEKNGPTWRIRDLVPGPNGKPRKETLESGFPTKTAAKTRMIGLKADQLRGEYIDPRGGKLTLNEWLDAWWPVYEASVRPGTLPAEEARMRNHIRPLLGYLPLDEIDHMVIQRWVAQLRIGKPTEMDPPKLRRRPLKPKTIRNAHGLLHRILGAAVKAKKIRFNPCADTDLPEVIPEEMRFLTEPEAARLITAVPRHWRPLVLLLLSTGLRWGEAIGLQIKHVDVLAGKLTVLRQMQELASTGEIIFGPPKTRMGRRTVPFPAKTVGAALAGLVTGDRDELVFHAPMGGEVRTRNFRRGWVQWVKAAGLEGLRIHDLRHTHAAWLISKGKPLTAIQRRLGHASIAVTSDLYGHLLPEVDESIVAAIEEALAHIDPEDLAAEVADELADELAAA